MRSTSRLVSPRAIVRLLAALAAVLVVLELAGQAGAPAQAGPAVGPPVDPLSPPPNSPRRGDPSWHVLVGATVHATPAQTFEKANVIIRDGLIEKVDVNGEAPPAGAQVWDCAGLHVYAGFIEPYLEVDVPAPDREKAGVHWNAKVTPQRRARDGAGVDAGTARALRALGFTAAAIAPRGGIFRGQTAVVSLAEADRDASQSRPPLYAEGVHQSVAFELGGGAGDTSRWDGYPESLMGAIALIRQTLIDAEWSAASGVESCLTTLEPARPGGAATLLFNAEDELDVLRAAKIGEEFKRSYIILGSGLEFRRLDAIAALKRPVIAPLAFPKRPAAASIGDSESVELRELMTWEQAPTNPRRLAEAGVTLALTTAKLRDRGQFRDNLRSAIRHGLKEETALAALTTVPAGLLGLKDQGVVEMNTRANLIVADGPIFAKAAKVRDVWIDGRRHEVNPAPARLDGAYDLTLEPPPKQPGKLTLLIDKDNGVSIRKVIDDAGPAAQPDAKPDAKPREQTAKGRNVVADSMRLSFVFEHEPLGSPGVFSMTGVVDGRGPARVIAGEGARADGAMFRWTAVRTGDGPAAPSPAARAALPGRYRITRMADAPVGPDGPVTEIAIGERDGRLTVTVFRGVEGKPVEGGEAKLEGDALLCDLDLQALGLGGGEGGPGVAKLTLRRAAPPAGGGLQGSIALPGGGGHGFEAERLAPPTGLLGVWTFQTRVGPDARPGALRARPDAMPVGPKFTLTIKSATEVTLDVAGTSAGVDELSVTETSIKGVSTRVLEGVPANLGAKSVLRLSARLEDGVLKGEIQEADQPAREFTGERRTPVGSLPAAKPDEPRDQDDEPRPDVPAKLPGYPFGAYAMEQRPPQGHVVLRGATVWTCGPQGVIENGEVEIKDGRIVYAGPARASQPAGAEVIDCAGKHITPGIIDCHSHTGISRGVNEGGQAVTAEVRIGDVTNPDAINWYRQLAGGVTAVNSLHGSANSIGGQNQVNKLRWGCPNPDDMHFEAAMPGIKFALGENPKWGNSGDARGGWRYPQTRMGVETQIRDRFTAAREYLEQAKQRGGDQAGPARHRDLELEALAEVLAGTRLVHCHSYRQDEILMLARVASEFGFKIGTYQHILEGYKVADVLREFSGGASGFSDWWAYKIEVQDAIPQAFPIMFEQGVVVSYNSDSDELARRLNVEAGKAVKYSGGGITPEEALKFVTLNPAKQLRIDGRVGSLEAGKDADLAVWSGPPISSLSRCEATYVDGRRLYSLAQDQALREHNRLERHRLIQKLLSDKKPGGGDAGAGGGGGGGAGVGGGGGGVGGGERRPGRRRPPQHDARDDESLRSGRPSLLGRMLDDAWDLRRELYLDLIRRGQNPDDVRAGECGCETR